MYKKSSDAINQTIAAGSFWQENVHTPRNRLEKEAGAGHIAGGALAGAGAGYYTSDSKSSPRSRLTRAAIGGALGAAAGMGFSKYNKKAPKPQTLSQLTVKAKLNKLSPRELKLLQRLGINKTASVAKGALILGTFSGAGAYMNYRKGEKGVSRAEFLANQRKDYLNQREKAGLKVSILDRKLNDMALQEVKNTEVHGLGYTVGKAALGGALVGGVAGHYVNRV